MPTSCPSTWTSLLRGIYWLTWLTFLLTTVLLNQPLDTAESLMVSLRLLGQVGTVGRRAPLFQTGLTRLLRSCAAAPLRCGLNLNLFNIDHG